MNCATHNDLAAVAFCRTCGKPLCSQCTRDVRGVIYCESCLAARMEGAPPNPPYAPPQSVYQQVIEQNFGLKVPPPPPTGPNPALAGILAGFFPIGVGAVYNGQYAKGLAHLVIMVLLIIGMGSDLPWFVITVLGISTGFFYVYQIIDAVRSARAIQLGQPAPDPFGFTQTFGTGDKVDTKKVPTGAAILIGLGVLFLLHTAGLFEIGAGLFVSLILIGLGVWLFAKHWGLLGTSSSTCLCEQCRTRKLMGPAILVTIGVLFLLDATSRVGLHKTWPAIVLVIGIVKLMQSNASPAGHVGPLPPGSRAGAPPVPPIGTPPNTTPPPQDPGQPSSSGEVKNV